MNTQDFLGSVLSDEGYYCITIIKGDYVKNNFYETLDEAIEQANNFDASEYNVYFALSTFIEPINRKQINVQRVKSFFFDLDCGPLKDFTSQDEALKKLNWFCKNNRLPRPTIINSGNGLHVYWPLAAAVDEATWYPVAESLKQLCAKQNFPADPSRTSDASSILRVPNTHNYKEDEPKPVFLLGGYLAKPIEFSEFEDSVGGAIPVPYRFKPSAYKDALNAQSTGSFKRLMEKTKNGQGCQQIEYIIENQATVSYDMWRAGLSIAKVCEDGDKAAEAMSKHHPDYSFDETIRKMMDTGGPQYCSTFATHNPDGCAGCPNMLTISTPAQLTKIVQEAKPDANVPDYPAPYIRGKNGGVYMRTKDEEDNPKEELIYLNDFYATHRMQDPEEGEVIAFALHLPKDGIRRFNVPLGSLTSREELRKALSYKGVTSYGDELSRIMKYIQAWVNELQQTNAADIAYTQFGWTDDEKMDAFVWGDRLVLEDEVRYNPPSAKTASFIEYMQPTGSAERQKEIMEFFNRDGLELHQFSICMGFASPLMAFTGLFSFLAHLNGGSGVGKTTALYANTGIWGDPVGMCVGSNDTLYSRQNRSERLKNISCNADEQSEMTPKDVSRFCYTQAEGKQRNRLKSSGNEERYRGAPWRQTGLSTGNISFWEFLQKERGNPEAQMQRVLEFDVVKYITKDRFAQMRQEEGFSLAETSNLFKDVQVNYCNFTIEYLQYVMKNRAQIESIYNGVKTRLDKEADLTPVNRFWSAGCACTITGCIVAKQLGIINYDHKKLFKWVVKELIRAKEEVEGAKPNVSNVIADFARAHWGNILKIKSTEDAREEDLIVPEQNPRNKIIGRYETDTKLMFIPTKELKDYLVDRFIHYSSTVKMLKDEMGAVSKVVRVTKGTSLNLPAQRCIIVKLDGLDDIIEVG